MRLGKGWEDCKEGRNGYTDRAMNLVLALVLVVVPLSRVASFVNVHLLSTGPFQGAHGLHDQTR